MKRRFLLAGLILMGAAAPAPGSIPTQTVVALYAGLSRPTPLELLSPQLRALMRKDLVRRERRLDFEWRSGGQERPEITGLRVRMMRVKGDSAVVEASFYNAGERRFRRFFLVRQGGRWLIDDVLLVPENSKLTDLLKGSG